MAGLATSPLPAQSVSPMTWTDRPGAVDVGQWTRDRHEGEALRLTTATSTTARVDERTLPSAAAVLTPLRFVSLLPLTAVTVLLGTFYWSTVGLQSTLETALPSSATLAATFSMYGSVPVIAAFAAWRSRQVEVYLADKALVRSRPAAFARLLWPIPVVGLLLFVVLLTVTMARNGNGVEWVLLLPVLLVIPAHVCLAVVFGRGVPAVVSVPVVALASWTWFSWAPASTGWLWWWRHLTAVPTGCCAGSTVPSVTSQAGAVGVALIWIIASVLALRWQRSARPASSTIAVGLVGLAGLLPGFAWIALTYPWGSWLVVQDASAPFWSLP